MPKPAAPAWHWVSPTTGSRALARVWGHRELLVAVGEHGAIVRSVDGGVTWRSVASPATDDFAGVSGGATGDVVVSGKSGALLVSHDRGASFSPLPSPANALGPVWTDGKEVILVGAPGALWRTTDAGKHWTAAMSDSNCGAMLDVREADGWLYASGESCIARSSDQGATWVDQAHNSNHAYAAVWRDGGGLSALAGSGVVRSADGGKTWGGEWQSLRARSRDTWGDELGRVVVGEAGMVERTLDHGATWVDLAKNELRQKTLSGVVASRGALVVVGGDGLVRRSTDGGEIFTLANGLTGADLSLVTIAKDGTAFVAGQYDYDGRIVLARSMDGGRSWELLDTKHDKQLEVLWASPNGDVYLGSSGHVARTPDGGGLWAPVPGAGQLRVMAGDAAGNVFGLGSYRFVRSSDRGATWVTSRISEESIDFRLLACAPDGTLYAVASGYDGVVARSTDHGQTWAVQRGQALGQALGLVATAHAVLVVSQSGVFQSTDGGKTWRGALGGDVWKAAYAVGNVVWAVGRGRVARSEDEGATWQVDELQADARAVAGSPSGGAIAVGASGTILRYGP